MATASLKIRSIANANREFVDYMMAEGVFEGMCSAAWSGMKPTVKLAASGSVSADALEVAAASASFTGLVAECMGKSSPSHRAGLDAAAIQMCARAFKMHMTHLHVPSPHQGH